MKKSLFTLALLGVASLAFAQKVTLNPAQPEANKPLQITYDPAGGKLESQAEVSLKAYTFVNDKFDQVDIPLKKEGNLFKGSYTPVDSTALALFTFSSGSLKDENPKGYYSVFYRDNKPVPYSYYWRSMVYNGLGKAYAGIDNDKVKATQILEQGIAEHALIRDKYYHTYVSLVYGQDKDKAINLANTEIKRISQKGNEVESDLGLIATLYTNVRMSAQADSIGKIILSKYPKGNLAYNSAYQALYAEKDLAKKEEALKKIESDFGFNEPNFKDKAKADNVYFVMAEAYILADEHVKFKAITDKISRTQTKSQIYNSFAWKAVENNKNIEMATEFSKKSLTLIEQAKEEAKSDKNADQILKGLDQNYAMFADTYAALLSKTGKYADAVKYQEIAVKSNNYARGEMNANYVSYLAKAGQAEKALEFGERFVKEGFGNDQMKADLKSVYKGSESFDGKYSKWEQIAYDKELAKYKGEMIDRIAPGFSLKNLDGEIVSLASLKGKVVIVDYWATWCGPCIASFPSMQKSVDKYKDDPNVAFVFINTWQNETNREEVVRNFMKANPYRFNVLLDTKKANDPTKFDVIEQYGVEGIPTKFILDGNGKIRFKKVGFNGDANAAQREMDILIALAKQATVNTK